jgi:Fe-Mn family superoxide dismutase
MNLNNVDYGIAAFHEVGRASTGAAVPKYDELASVSLPGRSGSGGFTFFISDEVERLTSDMGQIGSEMKQHVQGSYKLAKQLLSLNQKAVDDFSEALLHKATVSGQEFAQIMRRNGVAVWEQDFNMAKMDLLDWAPDLHKSTATKVAAVGAALMLSSSPAFADAVPTVGRFSDDAMPNVATYVLAVDSSDLGLKGLVDGWKGGARLSKVGGAFKLPPLPYDYKALEPNIPEATMKLHYEKFFAGYLDRLNGELEDMKNEGIITGSYPGLQELQKEAVANGKIFRDNAGGFYNHGLFFESMTPSASGKNEPSTTFAKAVDESFGSWDNMKAEFSKAASKIKGSGWAWLGVTPDGKLAITSTNNQDNPLMEGLDGSRRMIPVMGLDMQKHAYQLKFQDNKDGWIKAWFNVVNWGKVSDYYEDYGSLQRPVVWKGAEKGNWQEVFGAN